MSEDIIDLEMRELLLALYLIEYHRHAFSVRSIPLFSRPADFDPGEVRELVNLVMWLGNGMPELRKFAHAKGLYEIINRNAQKLEELISRAHEGNVSTHIIETIDQLNNEVVAADALMGWISDG